VVIIYFKDHRNKAKADLPIEIMLDNLFLGINKAEVVPNRGKKTFTDMVPVF